MHPSIPFLDLSAMHAEVAAELDDAWRRVTSECAFVGGPHVERFETEWADYCGTRHAVAVGSGTDALQLALEALDIGDGDEVLVPANTFVATAEAVVRSGATPRFLDVEEGTQLITDEIAAAAVGPRTAAIIVVHLYGHMPDIDAIARVATRARLALIEDAAQAHGATWRGKKAGSFGHAGCFSFYPGKNLGAFGDAGAVVTGDMHLAERVRALRNHGRHPRSKYLHSLTGTNSRMDGLQAAVLSAKLRRLDSWTRARRAAVEEYRRQLEGAPVRFVDVQAGACSAYHLNAVRVAHRDPVRELLAEGGVETGIHYPVPCHRQLAYERFSGGRLPVAERSAAETLSLPLFPHMTSQQISYVSEKLQEIVSRRSVAHAG